MNRTRTQKYRRIHLYPRARIYAYAPGYRGETRGDRGQ